MIQCPKLLVLDNATLGRLAKAYSCETESRRRAARDFIGQLTDRGFFVALSTTLLLEFFGHADEAVFRSRLRFLSRLPCIAWIRPYAETWFVGDFTDVLRRELHAIVHQGIWGHTAIVEEVRCRVWETGVGSDMFDDSSIAVWETLRSGGSPLRKRASFVASMVKSDPTEISSLKLGDIEDLPLRNRDGWSAFTERLIPARSELIRKHGDKRLSASAERAASEFYRETLALAQSFDPERLVQALCRRFQIPSSYISSRTTVGDLSLLVSVSLQLKDLGAGLRPPVPVTLEILSAKDLPTLAFEKTLQDAQTKAARYSGSDMCDSQIAALSLYADRVEVDKRTFDCIIRLRRGDLLPESIADKFVKSSATFSDLLSQL